MSSVSTYDAVSAIGTTLDAATTYRSVFGQVEGKTLDARRAHLKRAYRRLARLAHPDHVPAEHQSVASQVFTRLRAMWRRADDALVAGTYDTLFVAAAAKEAHTTHTLVSTRGSYDVEDAVFAEGDFSDLYRGTVSSTGDPVLLKIASAPTDNPWLSREATVLGDLQATIGTTLPALRRFLPRLLDTFAVTDSSHRRYHVLVFPYVDGLVSVEEVVRRSPGGLDHRDAAWIARRVVAQTLAAQTLGMVHGSITPDHVLVHAVSHEPLHIGWTHAVVRSTPGGPRITHVIDRWCAWYPPEVFAKQEVTHQSDVFMAGKTLVALFGGEVATNRLPATVPTDIARLIRACIEERAARRPQDGGVVLDQLTRAVRQSWGSVYRPLVLAGSA